MPTLKNIVAVGEQFNFLTVTMIDLRIGPDRACQVRCVCGRLKTVRVKNLFGSLKSCGCWNRSKKRKFGAERKLTLNGETLRMTDWAKKLGMTPGALAQRLERLPLNQALARPRRAYPRHLTGD